MSFEDALTKKKTTETIILVQKTAVPFYRMRKVKLEKPCCIYILYFNHD